MKTAIKEESVLAQINSVLFDGLSALNSIKIPERSFYFFWLLGPLFFLVERSPADIWVTSIGLAFLVRSTFIRDWSWLKKFWVRATLAFWFTLFVSSIFSPLPSLAFTESLIWIRFPLLAFASVFWFSRHPKIVNLMLLCTGLGVLCMMLINTTEMIFTLYNKIPLADSWLTSARLSWPYGDPIPGNYFAKFGLIITVLAGTLISEEEKQKRIAGTIAAFLLLVFTVLTGERINSILVFFTLVTTMVWSNQKNLKQAVLVIIFLSMAALLTMSTNARLLKKFTDNFWLGATNFAESGYIELWLSGLKVFYEQPFTGIGTGMYRFICSEQIFDRSLDITCNNHPHQFYIQALAETGALGFLAFLTMVASIVTVLWKEGKNSKNGLQKCCFIVPIAIFFPLQSSADLFGQWINGMTWYGIALAMTVCLMKSQSQKNREFKHLN